MAAGAFTRFGKSYLISIPSNTTAQTGDAPQLFTFNLSKYLLPLQRN
jgi:hypothetical protein